MFFIIHKIIKTAKNQIDLRFLCTKIIQYPSNNINKIIINKKHNLTLEERLLNYVTSLQNSTIQEKNNEKLLKNIDLVNKINDLNALKGKKLLNKINEIDRKCCERLPKLDKVEIFMILNSFATNTPYYVKNLKFFQELLNKIRSYVNKLSLTEVIQLCFYAGLLKKDIHSQQILRLSLKQFDNENILNKLKLDDLIILINAAFKTSMQINQMNVLKEIKNRVYDRLEILNDEAFFVTIIKSCRHNLNYDEEFLLTIANTMFFNKTIETYNFTALAHILTLYADALYFDIILIDNLYKFCFDHLKKVKVKNIKLHYSKSLRVKDLSRFLWSLSYLGYENFKNDDYENIILPLINDFVELGTVENNIEDFVGITLSLWTLGFYPENILPEVLKEHLLAKGNQHV